MYNQLINNKCHRNEVINVVNKSYISDVERGKRNLIECDTNSDLEREEVIHERSQGPETLQRKYITIIILLKNGAH